MRYRQQDMLHTFGRAVTAAAILLIASACLGAPANAFSKQVEKACRADYKNLCPQYRVNSSQLRACMESKANEISWVCVSALIDSGEVDRKRVRR